VLLCSSEHRTDGVKILPRHTTGDHEREGAVSGRHVVAQQLGQGHTSRLEPVIPVHRADEVLLAPYLVESNNDGVIG
jgi:hypothetical protein